MLKYHHIYYYVKLDIKIIDEPKAKRIKLELPNHTRLVEIANIIAKKLGVKQIVSELEFYLGWQVNPSFSMMLDNSYTLRQIYTEEYYGKMSVRLGQTNLMGVIGGVCEIVDYPEQEKDKNLQQKRKPLLMIKSTSFPFKDKLENNLKNHEKMYHTNTTFSPEQFRGVMDATNYTAMSKNEPNLENITNSSQRPKSSCKSLYDIYQKTNQYTQDDTKNTVLSKVKTLLIEISVAEELLEKTRIEFLKKNVVRTYRQFQLITGNGDTFSIVDLTNFMNQFRIYAQEGDLDIRLLYQYMDSDKDGVVSWPDFLLTIFGIGMKDRYLLDSTFAEVKMDPTSLRFYRTLFLQELQSQCKIESQRKLLWKYEDFEPKIIFDIIDENSKGFISKNDIFMLFSNSFSESHNEDLTEFLKNLFKRIFRTEIEKIYYEDWIDIIVPLDHQENFAENEQNFEVQRQNDHRDVSKTNNGVADKINSYLERNDTVVKERKMCGVLNQHYRAEDLLDDVDQYLLKSENVLANREIIAKKNNKFSFDTFCKNTQPTFENTAQKIHPKPKWKPGGINKAKKEVVSNSKISVEEKAKKRLQEVKSEKQQSKKNEQDFQKLDIFNFDWDKLIEEFGGKGVLTGQNVIAQCRNKDCIVGYGKWTIINQGLGHFEKNLFHCGVYCNLCPARFIGFDFVAMSVKGLFFKECVVKYEKVNVPGDTQKTVFYGNKYDNKFVNIPGIERHDLTDTMWDKNDKSYIEFKVFPLGKKLHKNCPWKHD